MLEQKRKCDFICDGDYEINSIIRPTHADNTTFPTGEVFKLQDSLALAAGENNIRNFIESIKIIQSDVIFKLTSVIGENNRTIRMVNAVKYVAPLPPRRTPQVPQRTPTNNNNNLAELQVRIIASYTRKIKIGDNTDFRKGVAIAKVRRESIQEFLVKFFTNWNEARNTVYVDDNSIQTEMGKRRSLGDIYMICRYYYPYCTLKEVARLLYVTLPTVITDGFRSSYCNNINKRVWYYDDEDVNGVYDKTTNDEWNHAHRWYLEQL